MIRQLAIVRLMFCLLVLADVASAADAVVISKDVPPDQLTASHLRNALLGRVTTWSDGRTIAIVLSRSAASQELLQTFLNRDLDHLLRGWKRLVFTGGGSLPDVTDDDALAIRHVAETPGAITIIAGANAIALPPGVLSVAIDIQQSVSKPDKP